MMVDENVHPGRVQLAGKRRGRAVRVGVVMVILFRSLLVPVVILCTLPLVVIGAFISLAVTVRALDLSALIGLLMLCDIVVTNAIVLRDLVRHKIETGADVCMVLS